MIHKRDRRFEAEFFLFSKVSKTVKSRQLIVNCAEPHTVSGDLKNDNLSENELAKVLDR